MTSRGHLGTSLSPPDRRPAGAWTRWTEALWTGSIAIPIRCPRRPGERHRFHVLGVNTVALVLGGWLALVAHAVVDAGPLLDHDLCPLGDDDAAAPSIAGTVGPSASSAKARLGPLALQRVRLFKRHQHDAVEIRDALAARGVPLDLIGLGSLGVGMGSRGEEQGEGEVSHASACSHSMIVGRGRSVCRPHDRADEPAPRRPFWSARSHIEFFSENAAPRPLY